MSSTLGRTLREKMQSPREIAKLEAKKKVQDMIRQREELV